MNTVFSKRIDSILQIGIYLEDFHIYNWALTKDQALNILDELEKIQAAIVGGDVLRNENHVYSYTGDSWYCNRESGEPFNSYVQRSISKARDYIAKYPVDENTYFNFVPC